MYGRPTTLSPPEKSASSWIQNAAQNIHTPTRKYFLWKWHKWAPTMDIYIFLFKRSIRFQHKTTFIFIYTHDLWECPENIMTVDGCHTREIHRKTLMCQSNANAYFILQISYRRWLSFHVRETWKEFHFRIGFSVSICIYQILRTMKTHIHDSMRMKCFI